jgi:hypothetical protein
VDQQRYQTLLGLVARNAMAAAAADRESYDHGYIVETAAEKRLALASASVNGQPVSRAIEHCPHVLEI